MAVADRLPFLFLVLVCFAGRACAQTSYGQLDTTTVVKLQGYIEGRINSTAIRNPDGTLRLPLLPAFVRLSFHDCNSPAGCDGCVNLGIAENNGLKPAVDNLENLYTNAALGISKLLSRADFWALAGLTAANYGARMQKPPPPPPAPAPAPGGAPPPPPPLPPAGPYVPASLVPASAFKTGRKDCRTAPMGNETGNNFPNGLNGQTETFAFFKNMYNFNANEAVAILGAHTLGRANAADAGFEGPWVPSNNVLNNEYYTTLSEASLNWAQVKAPTNLGKIQWQRMTADNRPLMMLNADMCLYKNLTLNATGGSKCTYATCPFTPGGSQGVLRYAANNTKWLDDFGAAFNKMMATCGRTAPGVVTPCTLIPLKATTASVMSVAGQPEEQGLLAGPVPVDVSLTTVEAAATQPVDVQPGPVAVEATGGALEGVAGATTATAAAPDPCRDRCRAGCGTSGRGGTAGAGCTSARGPGAGWCWEQA